MTIRQRLRPSTTSMGWKDTAGRDKNSGAMKPPDINPNGSAQKFKRISIERLREELLKMSTNTTGVAEARHLVEWIIKNLGTAVSYDVRTVCNNLASKCGLSERGQKRAMAKIDQILSKK